MVYGDPLRPFGPHGGNSRRSPRAVLQALPVSSLVAVCGIAMEGSKEGNLECNSLDASQQSLTRMERDEDEDVRIVEAPVKPKATSKKAKGKMLKTEAEDEEDRGARWKDEEIEMLIALRGEMDDDFKKNSKKQGKIFPKLVVLFRCQIV